MSELVELLYDYAHEYCLNRRLDPQAYHIAEMRKLQYSSSLWDTLSSEQVKTLESYLDVTFNQHEQELKAMFQAALKIASELQSL